jgi:hypothetical protein
MSNTEARSTIRDLLSVIWPPLRRTRSTHFQQVSARKKPPRANHARTHKQLLPLAAAPLFLRARQRVFRLNFIAFKKKTAPLACRV